MRNPYSNTITNKYHVITNSVTTQGKQFTGT